MVVVVVVVQDKEAKKERVAGKAARCCEMTWKLGGVKYCANDSVIVQPSLVTKTFVHYYLSLPEDEDFWTAIAFMDCMLTVCGTCASLKIVRTSYIFTAVGCNLHLTTLRDPCRLGLQDLHVKKTCHFASSSKSIYPNVNQRLLSNILQTAIMPSIIFISRLKASLRLGCLPIVLCHFSHPI